MEPAIHFSDNPYLQNLINLPLKEIVMKQLTTFLNFILM